MKYSKHNWSKEIPMFGHIWKKTPRFISWWSVSNSGFSASFRWDRNENREYYGFHKERHTVEAFINLRCPNRRPFYWNNGYFSYNPNKNNISKHLAALKRTLDWNISICENATLVADFNELYVVCNPFASCMD